jgi:hypothetical protein
MLPSASSLILTWLLAVPLLWAGCDKPLFKTDEASIAQPDELPPITTTGEGTFACKINGVNWQRCGGNLKASSLTGEWHPVYKIFSLQGLRRCEGFDNALTITAYIDSIGKYNFHYASYREPDLICQAVIDNRYRLVEAAENWIDILNLDKEEFIVSGTFQCTLVHEECGDTLFITDGRFDYDWAN